MEPAGPGRARIRNTVLLTALLVILALAGELGAGRSVSPGPRPEGPVLPRFDALWEETAAIRVTLADGSYLLTGTADGWRLNGPEGFAVHPDRIAKLAGGLGSLTFEAHRTRDPEKLQALGLGDPREGGNGALLDLLDRDGRVVASLLTGRRTGRTYVRWPGENQSFLVTGTLPPLHAAEAWLDLDVLDIRPETIAAVRLADRSGRTLYLRRPPGGNDLAFRAAPPSGAETLISPVAVAGPALALSRFRPSGVRPAAALRTEAVASHITETHDALEVRAGIFEEADGTFLTLHAVEAGHAAQRAAAINLRTAGWAFRIQAADISDFAPDVGTLIRPAATDRPGSGAGFDGEDPAEAGFLDNQDTARVTSRQGDVGTPP